MSDFRWWLRLARPYAAWFALGVLCSVLTLGANVALLALAGWFLASMAAAGLSGVDFNYYTPAVLIRGLAIVRTGGRYLERLTTHDATLRLLTGLRVWFYQQVEPLSMQRLQGLRNGDLLARVRTDIDTLDQVYLRLVLPMAAGFLCVVGAGGVLAWFSPLVAAVALSFLALAGIALPLLMQRLAARPGAQAVRLSAALKASMVEVVDGLGELTVFGAMPARLRGIHALSRRWIASQKRLSHLTGLSNAGFLLLTHLAVLASAGVLIVLVRAHHLRAIDFAPVILLVLGCFEAVTQMPAAWQSLGQLKAASRRLRAFEGLRPAVAQPNNPAPSPGDDTLHFSHVGVRHAPGEPWALCDITTTIVPGQHIAVVGASGAGKSTFLQLLLRLVDCQYGTLSWGGRPVGDYRSEDLRARVAAVPQQVYLFHASVRENLLLGRPGASEQAMMDAARAACIHDEIMAFPQGYDTLVGEEGMRLSGGQVRRVGIARALLRDAPVVLMDEPCEGLDTATEARLWRSLDTCLRGHTLIFASHRMSSVRHAQQILLLDRGALVASGTHPALLRSSSHYRSLCGHMNGGDERSCSGEGAQIVPMRTSGIS